MAQFTKDSLLRLKERVDLVDLLSAHVDLKRSGAGFKALCPFHDERSPSFIVNKGDSHYHCFGCGAHGDAISFLSHHLRLGFVEAVEYLAERFQVPLERVEGGGDEGRLKELKELLQEVAAVYQTFLLSTREGDAARCYLLERGIGLGFIERFGLGLAPRDPYFLQKALSKKYSSELLEEVGVIHSQGRDFFAERIVFPIYSPSGFVIGFSARKFYESTFGGKYINSRETPLFKKSRVLFGLNESRRRIAKESKAIVVEGQIDALRLIESGLNYTVASLGTAFGESHVEALVSMGVKTVYLAFDADKAGKAATLHVGDLFAKKGVAVSVVVMPPGEDPDSWILREGKAPFEAALSASQEFLTFLVHARLEEGNPQVPAFKAQVTRDLAATIRSWGDEVLIHESLKRLAVLLAIPESAIGIGELMPRSYFIPRGERAGVSQIDPDRILEGEFLRWLISCGAEKPHFFQIAENNISDDMLLLEESRLIWSHLRKNYKLGKAPDLLALTVEIEDSRIQSFLGAILERRINRDKAEEFFQTAIKRILERAWMRKRDLLRQEIQSGLLADDVALAKLREFDLLKKSPPELIILPSVLSG